MVTRVGRIGWGVVPPPEPPVVVMPVGGVVTPVPPKPTVVPPDDGITIPDLPEDAVMVSGSMVVTVDVGVTNTTPKDSPVDGQGRLPFAGGWLTGHE